MSMFLCHFFRVISPKFAKNGLLCIKLSANVSPNWSKFAQTHLCLERKMNTEWLEQLFIPVVFAIFVSAVPSAASASLFLGFQL